MALAKLNQRVLLFNATNSSLKRLLATQAAVKLSDEFSAALPYSEIPRPSYLPFIRSFMPGGDFYDSSMSEYALAMRKRCGDLFIMPGLFGRPDFVVCLNTADIEKIFRNEGQWPIRQGLDSVDHFRNHVKKEFFQDNKGLVVTQGEEWGMMRSKVNPVLMQPKNMKSYLQPLININNEFIERIKEIRDPHTLEVPADFEEEINRLTFESIALVALNKELGLIRKDRESLDAKSLFAKVRRFFPLIYKLDVEPSMWKVIRTPRYYEMMRLQKDIFETTHKMVNETLEVLEQKQLSGETEEELGVLEKLLTIDKKLGVIMAMDMLLAGVDATSVTLTGIMLCLAKNPEKQEKLREEILKILPRKDVKLTDNLMKNMPYLRAVIKESMRYYPNGPGTFRTSISDLTLSGYQIPAGTSVLLAPNLLLRDEKYFPQANQFLPERWLRDDANKKVAMDPFSFLPFGFGPRICAGKRIVEMELEISLINLVRNFHIEFNHNCDKPFKTQFLTSVDIPLPFKFSDVKY